MTDTTEMRIARLIDQRFRELEDRVTALEGKKPIEEHAAEDPFAGFARHRKSRQRGGGGAVQSG